MAEPWGLWGEPGAARLGAYGRLGPQGPGHLRASRAGPPGTSIGRDNGQAGAPHGARSQRLGRVTALVRRLDALRGRALPFGARAPSGDGSTFVLSHAQLTAA